MSTVSQFEIAYLLIDVFIIRLVSFWKRIQIKLSKYIIIQFRRSSIGTFIRPNSSEGSQPKPVKAAPPKLDYRSMVSIDDMPELFVSFDSKCENFKIFTLIKYKMGNFTIQFWLKIKKPISYSKHSFQYFECFETVNLV